MRETKGEEKEKPAQSLKIIFIKKLLNMQDEQIAKIAYDGKKNDGRRL